LILDEFIDPRTSPSEAARLSHRLRRRFVMATEKISDEDVEAWAQRENILRQKWEDGVSDKERDAYCKTLQLEHIPSRRYTRHNLEQRFYRLEQRLFRRWRGGVELNA